MHDVGDDVYDVEDVITIGEPMENPPSPSGGGFDPNSLDVSTRDPTDSDVVITKEGNTWYRKAFSKVWDYVQTKLGITNSGSTNKFLNEQGNFVAVPEGHVYDLEMNNGKNETTLTEDGTDKTTLPLVAEFVGTRSAWNALSATNKAKYRLVHFTDEQVSIFSHVGQIIESTTLDTEAKVKAIYGSGTSWIQHTGYVLRGAASNVSANHSGNDGGADSVTVSSVANHNHTQNAHNHGITSTANVNSIASYYGLNKNGSWLGTSNNTLGSYSISIDNKTATNISDGANYTVNTLPKYKNVYIWERVS